MPVTADSAFTFLPKQNARKGPLGHSSRLVRRPQPPVARDRFRSGVSLHSHTMFSEESLDMVPRYTNGLPYLGQAIRQQQAEYSAKRGHAFDFSRAYWTPPLTPMQAYRVEEKQIGRQFQLPALVSLTDHDDIRAAAQLHVMNRFREAPISTEWTIPIGKTFFHLGIHNLPEDHARDLHSAMTQFTAAPDPAALTELLNALAEIRDLLIVLNHPLWDEKGIGAAEHRRHLQDLLRLYGGSIHALELNGLRSWKENAEIIGMARDLNLPVVSGGDRHGREPNAILNLSGSASFSGFVEEVRYARKSHIVFMPQYREPLKLRVLQTMVDVVRRYPENIPGRRIWSDRVFFRDPALGEPVPLSAIWQDGGPRIVRQFIGAMQLVGWRGVRPVLRLALQEPAHDRLAGPLGIAHNATSRLCASCQVRRVSSFPDAASGGLCALQERSAAWPDPEVII